MTFSNRLKLALVALSCAATIGCEEVSEPRVGEAGATFFVDTIGSTNVQTTEFNALGFPKSRLIGFKACLKDRVLRSRLYDRPFTITSGTASQSHTSDDNGCIFWEEQFDFDYFAPEKNIEVVRTISAGEGNKGTIQARMAINPWSSTVYDLQRTNVKVNIEPNRGQQGNFTATLSTNNQDKAYVDQKSISLGEFRMDTDKFIIDENLTLMTPHTYQVTFNPTMYRKTINADWVPASAVYGRVKLTLMFMRDNSELKSLDDVRNHVTTVEKVLEIDRGTVKEDITIYFPDLSALSTRLRVLAKVEPLVESNNLLPGFFEGYVGPMGSDSASVNLNPTQLNVDMVAQKFEQAYKIAEEKKMSPVERFKKYSGLKPLTQADFVEGASAQEQRLMESRGFLSKTTMMKLLEGKNLSKRESESFLSSLCDKVYPAPTQRIGRTFRWNRKGPFDEGVTAANAYHYCKQNPSAFVGVQARDLVQNLTNTKNGTFASLSGTYRVRRLSTNLSIRKSYGKSSSHSMSWGFKAGASAGFGFGLPKLPGGFGPGDGAAPWYSLSGKPSIGLNIGVSGDYGYVQSQKWVNSTDASVTASETQTILVVSRSFNVNAMVQKCFIASPMVPEMQLEDGSTGKFFCPENMVEETSSKETFHLITQDAGVSGNPFVDSNDSREQPWMMMIRGNHTFQDFKGMIGALDNNPLKSEVKELVLSRWQENDDRNQVLDVFRRITQDYPGMLSPAEAQ